ncbi:MAG TPA: phosphate ABC transporter permease PstA [Patescibacteria group bacterium]|nr:phosphate ABC transporter permease PstA [Patescibacteria group bacterium]
MSAAARHRKEWWATFVMRAIALSTMAIVVMILGDIFLKGEKVLTWGFLTLAPVEGMTQGGIFPAIFGTLCVTLLMIMMALPLGVFAAIYMVEYAGRGRLARIIRAAVNNLAGVPSIVFGLFGLGFFVLFVGRGLDRIKGEGLLFGQPAMLWASATLAVLVLPVVIVSAGEALIAVPRSYREAAFALGATRWQVVRRVVLPQAWSGILTGAILSVSRGAGETAPILFTGAAFYLPRLPIAHMTIPLLGLQIPMVNPLDQFMELSYHVFVMATQSHDTTLTRPIQYGTAFVLVSLTFILNISAILLRRKLSRNERRA